MVKLSSETMLTEGKDARKKGAAFVSAHGSALILISGPMRRLVEPIRGILTSLYVR
jgi:hypothetical protein